MPNVLQSVLQSLKFKLRAFNEQTPLNFTWVEHKCFDVRGPPKIAPTPTSSEDFREISATCSL